MMQAKDFRADRAHGALLQRQAKLKSLLAMKDETAPFDPRRGFFYLMKGPVRGRIEEELRFIEETLAMFAE